MMHIVIIRRNKQLAYRLAGDTLPEDADVLATVEVATMRREGRMEYIARYCGLDREPWSNFAPLEELARAMGASLTGDSIHDRINRRAWAAQKAQLSEHGWAPMLRGAPEPESMADMLWKALNSVDEDGRLDHHRSPDLAHKQRVAIKLHGIQPCSYCARNNS